MPQPRRTYFETQSWYRPRRGARISAVARANRRWLARVHRRCLRERPPAPAWVRRRVRALFDAIDAGHVSLPARARCFGEDATPAELIETMRRLEAFTPRTPVRAIGPRTSARSGTWLVDSSHVVSECLHHGEEACEGFFGFELTFERGRLVALHVYAVG